MKTNNLLKESKMKNKIISSVFLLSLGIGGMFLVDNANVETIIEEQQVISEMTNRTLNISFVPNNPNMKDNINLFSPIDKNDIDAISKVQGVKSVKPIDEKFNPLSGYAKINSKSSHVELYGFDENGQDINTKDIEMVYGRAINSSDIGENVVVLNMETVNSLQVSDAKSLIGTGMEINGSVYEVIGVMNVVLDDERDNLSELQYASLIPKSTSKEILARAGANSDVYGSLMISIEEGSNINSVESSVYNILYENHDGINGFYERDAEYSLPKKLDPTLLILENFNKFIMVTSLAIMAISLIALIRVFVLNTKTEVDDSDFSEIDSEVSKSKEDALEEGTLEEVADEVIIEKNEDQIFSLKGVLLETVSIALFGFALSFVIMNYYLSSMDVNSLFNVSIMLKSLVVLVSVYMLNVKTKNE